MVITMSAWMAGEKSSLSILGKQFISHTHGQAEKREEPMIATNTAMMQQQVAEKEEDIDIDMSEVYFLIMHFLASGPCTRATGQLWNELLQHKLLPRRYHAWFSRSGMPSGDEDDDGVSFPLSYIQVVERNPEIEKGHLIKLLRQQLLAARREVLPFMAPNSRIPTAADVPTLLGKGSFSLLQSKGPTMKDMASQLSLQLRWPHWHANQVHGLSLRELGGGFSRHHRPPSIRAASYAVMKPSVLAERIQIIKKFRGHRNAVYCAIFDRTGQHIITGSDDRLVKIWSTETGFCLRSCRGHEGDITELSVSSGNTLVASASNDYTIRVWRLPDGVPISVLRGHTGAVTAISFSPRQSCEHHLLSSSDDGTCRIWDARDSSVKSRVYMPNPETILTGKSNVSGQPIQQTVVQISCCSFNADGSIFVTGSCDKVARVWDARKWNDEITGKPNHELDTLKGHENAVNYVQFSGCAGPLKSSIVDNGKDDRAIKFKNPSFTRDSIVTCSRDGSAIIWIYKPRKKDARFGRWVKSYHLRVPPPPMPPHPPRGGGPRQRFLPTPRGVNMIVWSLDNRFVLAAIMDCRICVWNAIDGSLVHSLTGHTRSTFVVDVHPFNPRIAMSAGYDGRIIIWDIWEGRPLRVYETGDFQIVDGSFSPDGTSLVVSDEVGQVYLLTTGEGQSQKDSKYDQFFLGDFRPLIRDLHGNVLDQETQLPPHQRNIQDLLCDANMIPYEEPYQSMYQQRRLGALGIDWQPLRVNLAVGIDDMNYIPFGEHPHAFRPHIQGSPFENTEDGARWVEQPTDADEEMDWEQDITKLSDDTTGSDYSVSDESLSLLDDDEGTASSTEVLGHTDEDGDGEGEGEEIRLRRSKRNKRKAERITGKNGKKVQKLPSDAQVSHERSEFGSEKRSVRQRQADVESSTIRMKSELQVVRPKRLAAKNALQLFCHINKNEGDDDEASSSHHETSSYCAEQENESDGLLSYLPHRNDHDVHDKEKDDVVDRENREEVSQSFGKDIIEIEGTEKDGGEDCKSNDKQKTMIYDNGGISWTDKNTEYFGIYGRDYAAKNDMISNADEAGSSSKILTHPRRLVLKLRKNEPVNKGVLNKDDLEDTESEGGNWSKTLENLGESTKRKPRRLIIKRPQTVTSAWDSAGVVSDTADNGDCTETSLRNHAWILERETQNNGRQLVAIQSQKYESATELRGESSPSSVSCNDDRSTSIKTHNICRNAYPGEILETSCDGRDVDSETVNQAHSHVPIRHMSAGKTFLDGKLARVSSPECSAEFRQILDGSDSNVYRSQEKPGIQNDKMLIRSRTDDIQYLNTNSRGSTDEELYEEEEEDDIAEISKLRDQGDGYFQPNKGRMTLARDGLEVEGYDDYNYLQMTGGDIKDADSLCKKDTNPGTIKKTSIPKRLRHKERFNVHANANDAVGSFIDGLNERYSESDYVQENTCWSASDSGEKVNTKTLKHKKRTLGDIESTRNLQNSSLISQRIQKMKSIEGRGVDSRLKRSRWKRTTMNAACGSKKQPNWEISQNNRTEVENPGHFTDISTVQDKDGEYVASIYKSDQIDLRMPVQGDALSTLFDEPVLRQTRSEKQRTSGNDAGRHVETIITLREKNVRTRKSLAWLLLTEVEEGTRYIPQFGDEVVYLRQGHEEYLNSYNIDEPGPWNIYQDGLRAVEFCRVVGLNYTILPISGETCCKFTLEFSDDASVLLGNTFWLTLSELTDFPDFIVEKSRYDASMERRWTNRDRCKIWWRSQNGHGGEWWEGRVVAVKPKSSDFPDSPWERLQIQYKSDPTEPYNHSPWELFDLDDARWEPPQLDQDTRERLLTFLEYAASEPEDLYGLRKLKQSSCKSDFINRLPLPLTLDVVRQRLEKNYYHSTQAFHFDVRLLASNAEIYCGVEHPMAQGLKLFTKEIYGEMCTS